MDLDFRLASLQWQIPNRFSHPQPPGLYLWPVETIHSSSCLVAGGKGGIAKIDHWLDYVRRTTEAEQVLWRDSRNLLIYPKLTRMLLSSRVSSCELPKGA